MNSYTTSYTNSYTKLYSDVRKNVLILSFILILFITSLSACGSFDRVSMSSPMAAPAGGGDADAAPAASAGDAQDAAPVAMGETGAAAAPAESAADASVALQASAVTASTESFAADGRKIIANAHLDLLVRDPKMLADAITRLAAQSGGYITAANLKSNGDLVAETEKGRELFMGTITLRVPPAKIEASLAGLEGLAMEVKSKTIDRQDVTDQYTDLDAQLRNLTATEDELRALLKEVRAKPNAKPEDILTVHDRVTQIRAQIEQIQGRKNMLENLVSLSTIAVSIFQWLPPQPQPTPTPTPVVVEPVWQPSQVAVAAKDALTVRLQQLTDRAIWFAIYRLPILAIYLIPLSLAVWMVRWVWRRVGLSRLLPVSNNS